MDETDEQLVAWAVAGDQNAFVELFWRHGRAVHAYLSRRAGRQEADDLLSEVWLRAFRARSTWSGPRVLPWLYGIAHNVLRAHWRQRPQPVVPPAPPDDPWAEIDAGLDASAQREILRRALAVLSENDREVLLLVVWEQLSPSEAAAVLGIPQGTARSRLHRALSILRVEGPKSPIACSHQEA
ncbi:MAG: RNA polymerase sigma factor [Acidimicrobiales bacterium]